MMIERDSSKINSGIVLYKGYTQIYNWDIVKKMMLWSFVPVCKLEAKAHLVRSFATKMMISGSQVARGISVSTSCYSCCFAQKSDFKTSTSIFLMTSHHKRIVPGRYCQRIGNRSSQQPWIWTKSCDLANIKLGILRPKVGFAGQSDGICQTC